MLLTRRTVLSQVAAPLLAPGGLVDPGAQLAAAARRQVGVTKGYDPAYRKLAYPGGDVPRSTGVCADVIIRAVRDAWGADLQRLVHEDMARSFNAYPQTWGLPHPDSNIDHRRVPNLETYWARRGARLWQAQSWTPGFSFRGELRPGDLLTWRTFPLGAPHVAVVTSGGAWPMIVQNSGWGTREEPLALMAIHAAFGHYRWRPPLPHRASPGEPRAI